MPSPLLNLALGLLAAAQPAVDANHDGRVTKAEFQASRRAAILTADANHDGRVTTVEWTHATTSAKSRAATRGYPSTGQVGQQPVFPQIDTNGDGVLTTAEIDAAAADRFAVLDANHDGVLTGDELKRMLAEQEQ
jgi:Ca2+-binding EF-hand superfamily protein